MAMQQKSPGNAHQKRNCWQRGNGSYSMRGGAAPGHFPEQEVPEQESAAQQ